MSEKDSSERRRIIVWVQQFKDRPNLVLQWHDPVTGKRTSRNADTADPKQAEHRWADLEADLNAGRFQVSSRMSWERFREAFETEYVAGLRPNTQRNHAATLDLFERLCHPKRVDAVTARTLSAFLAGMRVEKLKGGKVGMAPATLKMRLQFLRTAFQWAVEQEIIAKGPKFPKVKVPDKRPQPIPQESFERLLAKAPDDLWRAYLLAGWLGGLRLSEAYYLERERSEKFPWIDFDRDRIVFPAEFAKSVKDQFVPLDPHLRTAIEALPRHGRHVFRFVSRAGVLLSLCSISRRVGELARKAGVRLTMHSLRKGFGCCYAGKVPAQVLQGLMRHGDIKTTTKFYTNVEDAVMEAVLGDRRNDSRNKTGRAASADAGSLNVSPCEGKASNG
jgi:integrase